MRTGSLIRVTRVLILCPFSLLSKNPRTIQSNSAVYFGKLAEIILSIKHTEFPLGHQQKVGIRPPYRYEGRFGHFYKGTDRTNLTKNGFFDALA